MHALLSNIARENGVDVRTGKAAQDVGWQRGKNRTCWQSATAAAEATAQPDAQEPLLSGVKAHDNRQSRVLSCTMDHPSITTTFASGNRGVQVGHNSGHIETHVHVRPLGKTSLRLTTLLALTPFHRTRRDSTQYSIVHPFQSRPRLC